MIDFLKNLITENIAHVGYPAVLVLMALESANIPIPSELILPFAGILVSRGELNVHVVAVIGALGCVLGSVPSYLLGRRLGRTYLDRYGYRFLISQKQLTLVDEWMQQYGSATAFFSRLLPVVRTFISLPMGVAKAPMIPFVLLTFLGSWIWSYILTLIGVTLGKNWETLGPIWHRFDAVIIILILLVVGGSIGHHLRAARPTSPPRPSQDR